METTDLNGATPNTSGPSRIELLTRSMQMVIDSAYGDQKMTEQEITQTLGDLVKSKLLSADDSYTLRDRIVDSEAFTRSIDRRVKSALRRKGILSTQEIEAKLRAIETNHPPLSGRA